MGDRIGGRDRVLPVNLFQGGGQVQLEGGKGGRFPSRGATQSLAGNPGGDFEGARRLGQGHLFDFPVTHVLEETLRRSEEFLGGVPFLLVILVGPAGPVCGVLAARGGFGLDLLLEESGVKGVNAFAPMVFGGPVFDGGMLLAQVFGNGRKGAIVAELQEGHESTEGTRGFAGKAGKS